MKGNQMARKLDPISIAMLDYIAAVDKMFGLVAHTQPENEKDAS